MPVTLKTLFDREGNDTMDESCVDGNGDFSVNIAPSFHEGTNAIVICDDVLSACRQLEDETFQLIVSSPPYNIGKSYEKKTLTLCKAKIRTSVF